MYRHLIFSMLSCIPPARRLARCLLLSSPSLLSRHASLWASNTTFLIINLRGNLVRLPHPSNLSQVCHLPRACMSSTAQLFSDSIINDHRCCNLKSSFPTRQLMPGLSGAHEPPRTKSLLRTRPLEPIVSWRRVDARACIGPLILSTLNYISHFAAWRFTP